MFMRPEGSRRGVGMAVVALVTIGFLLTGCSSPWTSTASPEPHDAFNYATFSSVDPTRDLHPGDELNFTWEPKSEGQVRAKEPNVITLRAGLYGPFESVDQLKTQMSPTRIHELAMGLDLSGATLRIDPVQTDSWTNQIYTSTMKLPATLQPGFYSFVRSTTSSFNNNSTTGEAQAVLHVVAP